jgi:hypothetical protein
MMLVRRPDRRHRRPALTTLAGWLPAQPMIDAAARALQRPTDPRPSRPQPVVLAAWAVAGLVASLLLLRWRPSRPEHCPVCPPEVLTVRGSAGAWHRQGGRRHSRNTSVSLHWFSLLAASCLRAFES